MDKADRVVRTVLKNTYNELEVKGVILADNDTRVGESIAGIPIVCKVEEIPDYIQTRWVDSMLINVKEGTVLPKNLELTCIGMGVTVHRKLARVGENTRNQQLDSFGGYVVLSTNIRMGNFQTDYLKTINGHLRCIGWIILYDSTWNLYRSSNLFRVTGTSIVFANASGKKWKKI